MTELDGPITLMILDGMLGTLPQTQAKSEMIEVMEDHKRSVAA